MRAALDGAALDGGMGGWADQEQYPPGSFQAMLMNPVDPVQLESLFREPQALHTFGEQIARQITHLDRWEVGAMQQQQDQHAAAMRPLCGGFGDDSWLPTDDILAAMANDPVAPSMLASLVRRPQQQQQQQQHEEVRPPLETQEPVQQQQQQQQLQQQQAGVAAAPQDTTGAVRVSQFAVALAEAEARMGGGETRSETALSHGDASQPPGADEEDDVPALPDDIDADAFLDTLAY